MHRDIKPENLFLPGRDIARLKVLDFGIARLAQAARTDVDRTGDRHPRLHGARVVRGTRDITRARTSSRWDA